MLGLSVNPRNPTALLSTMFSSSFIRTNNEYISYLREAKHKISEFRTISATHIGPLQISG